MLFLFAPLQWWSCSWLCCPAWTTAAAVPAAAPAAARARRRHRLFEQMCSTRGNLTESYGHNRHSGHFRERWRLIQGVFSGTRGAQPLCDKAPDKHREGCPDWLPDTPARFSGGSTFLGASLRSTGQQQQQLHLWPEGKRRGRSKKCWQIHRKWTIKMSRIILKLQWIVGRYEEESQIGLSVFFKPL